MNHITVFGSSRCKAGESEYVFAEEVGELIGKYGHNVATGGYQGTMEAVSKGALNHGVTVSGVTVPSLFSEKSENLNIRIDFAHGFGNEHANNFYLGIAEAF